MYKTYEEKATRLLKFFMMDRQISYPEVAAKLNSIGIKENPANLANKINRGTFSFAFVLQIFQALDLEVNLTLLTKTQTRGNIEELQENLKEELWYINADILEQYIEQNSVMPTEKTVFKGRKINEWVTKQREAYSQTTLSFEKIARLDEIHPAILNPNDNFLQWNIKADALKQYVKELSCLPQQTTNFMGIKLGSWLTNQRYAFSKSELPQERIDILLDIHPDIFKTKEEIYSENWHQKANLLREYVKEHKSLPTATTIYKDVNLGTWLSNVKQNYKSNNLSQDRIDILLDIHPDIFKTKEEIYSENWHQKANLLKEYVEEHKSLPTATTIYKDVKLGRWINNQKHALINYKLSQECIDILLKIDKDIFDPYTVEDK